VDSTLSILPQLLINAAIAGSIYALAASGLALTYGVSRILNFAHGQTMMVGAYLFLFFTEILNAETLQEISATQNVVSYSQLFVAGGMALILAGALGALLFALFVAPFAGRNPLLPFVATVAAGKIFENTIAILFGVNVRSISSNAESYDLGFGYITQSQIFICISAPLVLGMLALLVNKTALGRNFRAVQSTPSAASALGISIRGTQLKVFVISAILAAFAGILVGYETSLQPTMGASFTVKALAVMVLGGLGNIWGTIIASYILAAIETVIVGVDFGAYSLPIGYRDAVAFIVLLVVLLWRPHGVLKRGTSRSSV